MDKLRQTIFEYNSLSSINVSEIRQKGIIYIRTLKLQAVFGKELTE